MDKGKPLGLPMNSIIEDQIFYLIGIILMIPLSFFLKKKYNLTNKLAEQRADYYITYLLLAILVIASVILTAIYS
jgi:hypothetical protein